MLVKSRSNWYSLKQNIIDSAVNEWRKRLLACVRIVGQHFKQFYCRQLKNGQLDKISVKVSEMWTKCVLHVMLIKQSYRIGQKSDILLVVLFPGSAETNLGWGKKTKRSVDGKLCQEYSYQKLSKSDNWFSSYSQKCLGCFLRHSILIKC